VGGPRLNHVDAPRRSWNGWAYYGRGGKQRRILLCRGYRRGLRQGRCYVPHRGEACGRTPFFNSRLCGRRRWQGKDQRCRGTDRIATRKQGRTIAYRVFSSPVSLQGQIRRSIMADGGGLSGDDAQSSRRLAFQGPTPRGSHPKGTVIRGHGKHAEHGSLRGRDLLTFKPPIIACLRS